MVGIVLPPPHDSFTALGNSMEEKLTIEINKESQSLGIFQVDSVEFHDGRERNQSLLLLMDTHLVPPHPPPHNSPPSTLIQAAASKWL
jgi:hypothetical protein